MCHRILSVEDNHDIADLVQAHLRDLDVASASSAFGRRVAHCWVRTSLEWFSRRFPHAHSWFSFKLLAMNHDSSIENLQREVALLRTELESLRRALGADQSQNPMDGPLRLRVASLEVVGEKEGRFRVSIDVEELGGALRFGDLLAGNSKQQGALLSTEDGIALALCGSDGVPRAVLSGRETGGGLSLLDERHNLAAELFGTTEASWGCLCHAGTLAAVSVASEKGGNLELFDGQAEPRVVLPPESAGAHSPE